MKITCSLRERATKATFSDKKNPQQVVAHQPTTSFSNSFLSPFNRAGGRTSNVLQEMKTFAFLALMLTLNLVGCGKGKSTDTASTAFKTVAEKQEFLERYVKFRRSYEDIHFRISFIDGDSGRVTGPTEWNIRLIATVPADEIDQWIDGLGEVKLPDLEWIREIPNAPTNFNDFKWYQDGKRIVGVSRVSRRVLYRNHAS